MSFIKTKPTIKVRQTNDSEVVVTWDFLTEAAADEFYETFERWVLTGGTLELTLDGAKII